MSEVILHANLISIASLAGLGVLMPPQPVELLPIILLASLLQIFQNPHQVVAVLLIQVLGALLPSIPVCLTTAMDRASPDNKLQCLLGLYEATTYFARSLETAMLPSLSE